MEIDKSEILEKLCYTKLVYGRINKKLNSNLSDEEIEKVMYKTIDETEEKFFEKKGKNYYVSNVRRNIRITINASSFRIITVDRIKPM